jgi:hypothetical protein
MCRFIGTIFVWIAGEKIEAKRSLVKDCYASTEAKQGNSILDKTRPMEVKAERSISTVIGIGKQSFRNSNFIAEEVFKYLNDKAQRPQCWWSESPPGTVPRGSVTSMK